MFVSVCVAEILYTLQVEEFYAQLGINEQKTREFPYTCRYTSGYLIHNSVCKTKTE